MAVSHPLHFASLSLSCTKGQSVGESLRQICLSFLFAYLLNVFPFDARGLSVKFGFSTIVPNDTCDLNWSLSGSLLSGLGTRLVLDTICRMLKFPCALICFDLTEE